MRRIIVVISVATLGLGWIAVSDWFLVRSRDDCPVNRIAYEQVEEGMTLAEVEGILGGPAGWYATEDVTCGGGCGNWSGVDGKEFVRKLWVGNRVSVDVAINQEGRVEHKRVKEMFPAQANLFDRIQTQLGL
jgi:hypothetical protein